MYPTDFSKTSEAQNPSINVSQQKKVHRSSDFEALKLRWKGRSGSSSSPTSTFSSVPFFLKSNFAIPLLNSHGFVFFHFFSYTIHSLHIYVEKHNKMTLMCTYLFLYPRFFLFMCWKRYISKLTWYLRVLFLYTIDFVFCRLMHSLSFLGFLSSKRTRMS